MFVIGDIHGEINMLKNLYDEIKEYDEEIFAVGDLVDRGPEPMECIKFIRENKIRSVIGNHEEMFLWGLDPLDNGRMHMQHMRNGGLITLTKFQELNKTEQEDIAKYIGEMPRYIITQTVNTKIYIMHAGFMLNKRIGVEKSIEYDSHGYDFLWYREEYIESDYDDVDGLIITGHTPMKKVCGDKKRIFVDTGAVFGGPLSAIRITDKGIIEVHQYSRIQGYSCQDYKLEV